MIMWLRHFLGWLRSAFCAREDLILENLVVMARTHPGKKFRLAFWTFETCCSFTIQFPLSFANQQRAIRTLKICDQLSQSRALLRVEAFASPEPFLIAYRP